MRVFCSHAFSVLFQYCTLFYCRRHTVTSVKRWIWRCLDFLWLTASIQVRLWWLRFLWPFGYYDQSGHIKRRLLCWVSNLRCLLQDSETNGGRLVGLPLLLGWRFGTNENPGSRRWPNWSRLGESGSPFWTSYGCKLQAGSPATNEADCHWWVPKGRLLRHAGWATSQL